MRYRSQTAIAGVKLTYSHVLCDRRVILWLNAHAHWSVKNISYSMPNYKSFPKINIKSYSLPIKVSNGLKLEELSEKISWFYEFCLKAKFGSGSIVRPIGKIQSLDTFQWNTVDNKYLFNV